MPVEELSAEWVAWLAEQIGVASLDVDVAYGVVVIDGTAEQVAHARRIVRADVPVERAPLRR